VKIGLPFYKSTHGRDIIVSEVPVLIQFITRSRKVVFWVKQRDLLLIWRSADLNWLVVDGVAEICVVVTEFDIAKIVHIWMEVPITGNVIEGMILHHEVNNMLDLETKDSALVLFGNAVKFI
jgi:hypothetical protein